MNITNMETAQATISIFCGLACLLSAYIIILNGYKRKSLSIFKKVFFFTAILFVCEGLTFIFQGNIQFYSIVINKAATFVIYVLHMLLSDYFAFYAYTIVSENGGSPNKLLLVHPNIAGLIGIILHTVNLFTGCTYTFSRTNYMEIGPLWYVAAVCPLIGIITGVYIGVRYRKFILKITWASILMYAIIPVCPLIIQPFVKGINITNYGLALTLFVMFIAYVYEWNRSSVEEKSISKSRRVYQVAVLFLIMTFSMSASLLSCIYSISKISKSNSMNDSLVIANVVDNTIDRLIYEPVMVTDVMSGDAYLIETLKKANLDEPDLKYSAAKLNETLSSVKNSFDYKLTYAQSKTTKALYTSDGNYFFSSSVDESNWYRPLLDKTIDYAVKSDNHIIGLDEDGLYISSLVYDEFNNSIGACGIELSLRKVEKSILELEKNFNITVYLTDKNGDVKIDSDGLVDDATKIPTMDFDAADAEDFTYNVYGRESRMVSYRPELDWYLVVVDHNPNKINVIEVVAPGVIIFIGGIVMMGLVFGVMAMREQRTQNELVLRKKNAITDELTGLLNRRAFAEKCRSIEETRTKYEYVIIVLDINSLKVVNDTLGHSAGDELIVATADAITHSFGKLGTIYRTGGDEFVALLQCSEAKARDGIGTFTHLCKKWKGKMDQELSVSAGVVVCKKNPQLSFAEAVDAADKLMYEEKEAYYDKITK